VRNDEIADAIPFHLAHAVVFGSQARIEMTIGKEFDQPANAVLDQLDTSGFKRLQKPAGKAHGHAIAPPERFAAAGGKAETPGIGQRRPAEAAQQGRLGRSIVHVGRGIDNAISSRCCKGMRHCHPAARAVERVNGAGAS
jgi:hypothetical protein